MRNHISWKKICVTALVALLLVACKPESLPGESGLAVEYVGESPADFNITSAFMSPIPITPGEAVYSAKGLPSGVPQFVLGVIAHVKAAEGANYKIDYELFNNQGLVETEILGNPVNWTDPETGKTIIMFTVRPKGKASFPDGPYQAKILLDKKVMALLNWTIGSRTP